MGCGKRKLRFLFPPQNTVDLRSDFLLGKGAQGAHHR